MPKLLNRPPKMSKKSDGHAYVTIQGERIYLGSFGSEEALKAYNVGVVEYGTIPVGNRLTSRRVIRLASLQLPKS